MSACAARGPGPQPIPFDSSGSPSPGRAARTRSRMASTMRSPIGARRTRRCASDRSSAVMTGSGLVPRSPGGFNQYATLGRAVGISDIDLHEESVQLRLRQRIGALLLERVLRRQHMERRRQIVPHARHRDMMLLHRLKQRRLRARAGAVDLVRHQQLGENRPRMKRKARLPSSPFLHDFRPEDVGRHQVGRELHAQGVEADTRCPASRQASFWRGPARRSAGRGPPRAGRQRMIDDPLLAEDDGADCLRAPPLCARGPRRPPRVNAARSRQHWSAHYMVLAAQNRPPFRFRGRRTRLGWASLHGEPPSMPATTLAHKQAPE